MRVLTCDELRQIMDDARGRADPLSSVLIQRAGYAIAQFCLAHFKFRAICVVCGAGGDGDYGLMAAQVLSGIAEQVSVIVLAKDASGLSPEMAAICESLATEPFWVCDETTFQDKALQQALEAELIIDAVAERGFKGPLERIARKAVEAINQASGIVVSIGVPSGVEPDSNVPVHEGGGPLLRDVVEADTSSPLSIMDIEERLVADYHGTRLTVGPHPMAYRRREMRRMGIKSAAKLKAMTHGKSATVGGCVITRQRPGTAKGLIFMTLEDETGNSNVIVTPAFYEKNRVNILYERFVQISGTVQNQDGIVHLKAEAIGPLAISSAEISSHDFH
jgi:hydroxyethylthiazole kinase-like uncharacterized protein yjeF